MSECLPLSEAIATTLFFWVANPNIATTFFGICFTLVTPDTIIKNGYSLNVDIYLAHEKRHYEDIDVEAVQQALLKQQRNTALIIRKLNYAFTNG